MTANVLNEYLGKNAESRQVELNCSNCMPGQYAIYAPSVAASPDELRALRSKVEGCRPGRLILREGESLNLFGTLRSGWAFRFKNLGGGRRQILGFLLPGDPVTMEKLWIGNRSLPYSVAAITGTVVCWFPLDEMILFTQQPGAQAQYAQHLAHRYYWAAAERLAALGQKSAHARTALLMLQLVKRLKERNLSIDHCYEFPLTQSHIADAVGVTTVHANRILRDLTKRGVLEIKGKVMRVHDEIELKRVFDEE
jgi:CRP-like cAMP-binding protein